MKAHLPPLTFTEIKMKRMLTFWHRRRSQRHAALAVHKRFEYGGSSVFGPSAAYHESWSKWHLAQIERLNNL